MTLHKTQWRKHGERLPRCAHVSVLVKLCDCPNKKKLLVHSGVAFDSSWI